MANYKESDVVATEWQRCNRVVIENPYLGAQKLHMMEERIMTLPDGLLRRAMGELSLDFAPDEAFPLLDPATSQPTGALMSHGELYQALYSLYMQTASERDAV